MPLDIKKQTILMHYVSKYCTAVKVTFPPFNAIKELQNNPNDLQIIKDLFKSCVDDDFNSEIYGDDLSDLKDLYDRANIEN